MEEIKKTILDSTPTAENISIQKLVDNFASASIYYAEYNLKGQQHTDDDFYYVLVDKKKNVWLYDDGVDAIENLKVELDKRLSIRQRLSEFTLVELISAIIAIIITATIVLIIFTPSLKVPDNIISQIMNIFLIIIGFYFGKNVKS